jgi:hypothetical protein
MMDCFQPQLSISTCAATARYLALRGGERADARAAAVDATIVILRAMPAHETESFATFVTKLSRNPKARRCRLTRSYPC